MSVCQPLRAKQRTIGYLDNIVTKIQQQQFTIIAPPEPEICKTGDVRHLCKKEKIIGRGEIVYTKYGSGRKRVILLELIRWIMPQQRWCDVPTFLTFLDESHHRKLLRCFVLHARRSLWNFEALLKQIGPGVSPMALEMALQFAERQGFVVAHHQRRRWSRGPQLEHVLNFGATFEWIVQAHLQQVAHAVARRGVVLKELQEQQLGDLDILAFTDDGLVITVECKSSASRITNEHLARYLQRARTFPADIALLLIDTDKEEQITRRIEQLNVGAQYELGDRYLPNSSVVYRIMGNLYIANTGGSIATALEAALHLATRERETTVREDIPNSPGHCSLS